MFRKFHYGPILLKVMFKISKRFANSGRKHIDTTSAMYIVNVATGRRKALFKQIFFYEKLHLAW